MILTQEELNSLPPYIAELLRQNVLRMEEEAQRPYQPYPGSRLAELNPEFEKFFTEINENNKDLLNHGDFDYSKIIYDRAREPFSQKNYNLNPGLTDMLSNIDLMGNRSLFENIVPAVNNKHIGLGYGGYGSTAHQREIQRAIRDLNEKVLAQKGDLIHSENQNMAKRHSAMTSQELDNLRSNQISKNLEQSAYLKDLQNRLAAAQGSQDLEQDKINRNVQEHERQQSHPWMQMNRLSNVYNSIQDPGVQMNHINQTPPRNQVNAAGQVGAAAGNLLGMMQAFNQPQGIFGNNFSSRGPAFRLGGYINLKNKKAK